MHSVYSYILLAALVTYLIRVLPLVLWRKEIKSSFVNSFLYYVPYACLAAMTFPAILTATESLISGLAGFLVAGFLAFRRKSMVVVALWACVAVFIVERLLPFF
jgi:branched-subunit amino acid transport protein